MSDPREIEAKFDINKRDRDMLMSITSVGRFDVQDRRIVEQEDVYFDTDGSLLAAAGCTLRIRKIDSGTRMTFKGRRESHVPQEEAHIASRLEDEVQLTPEQAATISIDESIPTLAAVSPLQRARAIVGHSDLRPVARLQNTRMTLLLGDKQGATLELAVDDCVGTRLRDGRTIAFDEIEVETKSSDRAALIEVSNVLREIVPSLRPSHATKLGRTLG